MSHSRHQSDDLITNQYRRLSSSSSHNIPPPPPSLISYRSISENSSLLTLRQPPPTLQSCSSSPTNVARVHQYGILIKVVHIGSNDIRGSVSANVSDIINQRRIDPKLSFSSFACYSWMCRLAFRLDDIIRFDLSFSDNPMEPELIHTTLQLHPFNLRKRAIKNPNPDIIIIPLGSHQQIFLTFIISSPNIIELQNIEVAWSIFRWDIRERIQRVILSERIELIQKKLSMYYELCLMENVVLHNSILWHDAMLPIKLVNSKSPALIQLTNVCSQLEIELKELIKIK